MWIIVYGLMLQCEWIFREIDSWFYLLILMSDLLMRHFAPNPENAQAVHYKNGRCCLLSTEAPVT